MPLGPSQRTVTAEPRTTSAGALPPWAQAVFPDGLLWESGRVWSPRDFVWDMAEEARLNQAAGSRTGGGLEASRHFEALLGAALAGAAADLPAEALVLDLRSGDGARGVAPWLRLLPRARIVAS